MTVSLYRCETCGKWSTAKRRPQRHKAWHRPEGAVNPWSGWFDGQLWMNWRTALSLQKRGFVQLHLFDGLVSEVMLS